MLRGLPVAILAALALAVPAAAAAPVPIPEGPDAAALPRFIGAPAPQRPVSALDPPRNPFMAPNSRSNLHVDAYQTDVHLGPGPLGRGMTRTETFLEGDCASVTFDSKGRIVTVCVGVEGPKLFLLDARTLETLATFPLPPRVPGGGSIFNDFAGGGYFYLDDHDRAVIPTTSRHVFVVGETPGGGGFTLEHDYDLGAAVLPGDKIVSALPDYTGRLWFVSSQGVVGFVDPGTGTPRSLPLREAITNSFAVDETGGIYLVTEKALYRVDLSSSGFPVVSWREPYANSGIAKPGEVGAGSGTTPTLLGAGWVAITDNADPMDVVVYRRAKAISGSRLVCTQPVFEKGASATDNSLIGVGRSLVVENNYGYSGPTSTENGRTTAPGLERVDLDAVGTGCHAVWHSGETAPTVVPKLSAANGIVYTYTKDVVASDPQADAWYLTALDFRTGRTLWKRLGGEGLGHNNNYAPITLGPDGTAYIGVLGGLVALRDATPPPGAGVRRHHGSLRLHARHLRGGRVRLRVVGAGVRQVRRVRFYARGHWIRTDRRRPFTAVVARRRLRHHGRTRLVARILRKDGTRAVRVRRVYRR